MKPPKNLPRKKLQLRHSLPAGGVKIAAFILSLPIGGNNGNICRCNLLMLLPPYLISGGFGIYRNKLTMTQQLLHVEFLQPDKHK